MIVLAAINARYTHPAAGARCLLANMEVLREQTILQEFDLRADPVMIAHALAEKQPAILGIGVYIWNVRQVETLLVEFRKKAPSTHIVLGGPEISHETETHPLFPLADYTITGEADLAFAQLCKNLLNGKPVGQKIIHGTVENLDELVLPYDTYTDHDIRTRTLYVETSRGCPYACEFCLSSVDAPLRAYSLEKVFQALETLLQRGVTRFKFLDRTFNFNPERTCAILDFFLARNPEKFFLHFEIVADRLSEPVLRKIQAFPPGGLQLEVGLQTFNPEVAARINRRQNFQSLENNLRWLRGNTGCHLHTDLIAGLPGETEESLAAGFDQLVALNPHEIQLNLLKHLRGTPIIRHKAEWDLNFNPSPPYEIISTKTMNEETLKRIDRFARCWNLLVNSGRFAKTVPLTWNGQPSCYRAFMQCSEFIHARHARAHGLTTDELGLALMDFLWLQRQKSLSSKQEIAESLLLDYQTSGRPDVPLFLRPFHSDPNFPTIGKRASPDSTRQSRHLAAQINP